MVKPAPIHDGFDALADGVYRLSIPVPFEVGAVNLYIVDRGALTLIDTGPRCKGGIEPIVRALAAVSRSPEDLAYLVLTHAHIDHHGQAAELLESCPARVLIHEDDADDIIDFCGRMDEKLPIYADIAGEWGCGAEEIDRLKNFRAYFHDMARDLPRDRVDLLRGPRGPLPRGTGLEFVHCPGHTAGLITLYSPDQRLLYSSDHLLPAITPNPNVYVPPYRGWRTGLADYLASLEGLRSLDVEWLLPGHGPPFQGMEERIDACLRHHEDRVQAILGNLAGGPKTVVDVAARLWKGLDVGGRYLANKEVHAHLEILEREGRVARDPDSSQYRLSPGGRTP